MPGAFLKVEGLINGAVQIEHEMDAEAAKVVQDLEALTTGARGVEVEDELIDDIGEEMEIPAAATDLLELFIGKLRAAEAVAIRAVEGLVLLLGGLPIRLIEGGEAALHAIGIVTAGVEPQDDGGAGVNEAASDNDFIAETRGVGARTGKAGAAGEAKQQRASKGQTSEPRHREEFGRREAELQERSYGKYSSTTNRGR